MTVYKQSFPEIWTRRAFRDWRNHITSIERDEWLQQLSDSHVGSWHRIIVSEWANQPFTSVSQAWHLAGWLHDSCDDFIGLITPRGRSHISLGVQIWCANVEHVLIIHLMANQIAQNKEFSHDQFVDHMRMTLNWMVK